jgi:hypothetical protein
MTKNDLTASRLEDILTEEEVLNFLGVKKAVLDDLRLNQGLPFCRITKTTRLYLVDDLVKFVLSKRMVSAPSYQSA